MSISTPIETMHVFIENDVLHAMVGCGKAGYPEEVVGFMLGIGSTESITVQRFLQVENHSETEARYHSYHISSYDWLRSENKAKDLGVNVVGVFHTHPNHSSTPSVYDLEFALPNFIYIIAAIRQRKLAGVQAWKLREDRSQFDKCQMHKIGRDGQI